MRVRVVGKTVIVVFWSVFFQCYVFSFNSFVHTMRLKFLTMCGKLWMVNNRDRFALCQGYLLKLYVNTSPFSRVANYALKNFF